MLGDLCGGSSRLILVVSREPRGNSAPSSCFKPLICAPPDSSAGQWLHWGWHSPTTGLLGGGPPRRSRLPLVPWRAPVYGSNSHREGGVVLLLRPPGLMSFRNSFTYLFVTFGCAGSSALPGLFSPCCTQASHCRGSCRCAARALGQAGFVAATRGLSGFSSRAQDHGLRSCGAWAQLCCASGIFWIRDRTPVSYTGRWILYPWATREAHGLMN